MEGRLEHKLSSERRMFDKIKNNEYHLLEFYNYLSSSYEYTTKKIYVEYVIKFLSNLNVELNKIDSNYIISYLNNLSFKNDNGTIREMSGTYRATIHSALRLYFLYLYNNEYIECNIMDKVPRPKNKKSNQINRIYLNAEEMQEFIDNIQDSKRVTKNRDLLIAMMFLYTGIRCTALTEINIEDIDFDSKTLKLIEKRNKYREFYIDDDMIILIKKVIKNRTSGALFLSNRGKRMSQSSVKDVIEKYTKCFNKHITPHKLRHSYGTNMYNETHDIYAVKNAMGHENISTTQIYIHEDIREAGIAGTMAMKKSIKITV